MSIHPSSSSVTIPYSDMIPDIPKINKRKHTYKALISLSPKISSATNFFGAQRAARRDDGMPIPDSEYPQAVRTNGCEVGLGEYCNLGSKRLKSEKAKDIEITATVM